MYLFKIFQFILNVFSLGIKILHLPLTKAKLSGDAPYYTLLSMSDHILLDVLSFDTWKKMMDEQDRTVNEAFRSQSQMLNDAIREFSENNSRMISNAIRHQAEIFNQ